MTVPVFFQESDHLLVREDCLWALDERLADLRRVADRLKVEAPSYKVLATEVREVSDDSEWFGSRKMAVRYSVVELHQPPIVLPGGWQFVAAIDHDPNGNIIRRHPAYEGDLEEYRHAEPTCDHCGQNRQRKVTIVARNQDGEFKRVGGSCVLQVLGGLPNLTDALWSLWNAMSADSIADEGSMSLGAFRTPVFTVDYLTIAAAMTRIFGYQARNDYGYETTKDRIQTILTPPTRRPDWMSEFRITEEDRTTARLAVEHLRSLETADEFQLNMTVAAQRSIADPKAYGILAYVPQNYLRYLADQRVASVRETAPETPKQPVALGRIVVTGIVQSVYTRESDWGIQHKVIVLDDRGFKVCGTAPIHRLEAGDRIQFTATVEPSGDDIYFGFFKRPAKAQLLEEATQ